MYSHHVLSQYSRGRAQVESLVGKMKEGDVLLLENGEVSKFRRTLGGRGEGWVKTTNTLAESNHLSRYLVGVTKTRFKDNIERNGKVISSVHVIHRPLDSSCAICSVGPHEYDETYMVL